MKNYQLLLLALLVVGAVFHANAQVTNLKVNGFSSNFTIAQGDSLKWEYNLPAGGTASGAIWIDLNGNGVIDPTTDKLMFGNFTQTDGQSGDNGPGDMDGLVNGHIYFAIGNDGVAPAKYILKFTNNGIGQTVAGTVTALPSPAFTISGKITPPPGVSTLNILVGANDNGTGWWALTDGSGNYTINFNAAAGGDQWKVKVQDQFPPYIVQPSDTTITLTGSIPSLNFTFAQPAAKVVGYLRGKDGHVFANVSLSSSPQNGDENKNATTDANGFYQFGYTTNEITSHPIWETQPDNSSDFSPGYFPPQSAPISIHQGDSLRVDLIAYVADDSITGKVTIDGHAPSSSFSVAAYTNDSGRTYANSDPTTGNFTLHVTKKIYNYSFGIENNTIPSGYGYSQMYNSAHPGDNNILIALVKLAWLPQTSNASDPLKSISFVNATTGWVAGGNGTILHTTNAGTTWVSQTTPSTTATINGIYFVNSTTGWIVGNGGVIKKTTDGGGSWSSQNSTTSNSLNAVQFIGAKNGWVACAGASDTKILTTTDGGTTWVGRTTGTGDLTSLSFVNADTGWAVGYGGTISMTTDGGTSWTNQSPYGCDLVSVHFVNSTTGWAVGNCGNILRTTNAGSNWSQQSYGGCGLNSVYFINSTTGWAVGSCGGNIVGTTSGGSTWTSQISNANTDLYAVQFVDANNGWAVGGSGIILHTVNGGTPPIAQISGNVRRMVIDNSGNLWFLLSQNTLQGKDTNYTLEKVDRNLALVHSMNLPVVSDNGFLGLAVDSSGYAWVEISHGSGDNGTYSVFYKVNKACSAFLDSALCRSSYNIVDFGGGLAIDPSGNVWSAGIMATDTAGLQNSPHFQHALWKFNNQGQLYSGYPKTYHRGNNGDGSVTTVLDANGNIYGIGISRNGTGLYDIGLWKYDPTGALAAGFPKFVPDWFTDMDNLGFAAATRGNALWIANRKLNAGVNDLALLKFDLNGNLILKKYWHTLTHSDVEAQGTGIGQDGTVWVVGDIKHYGEIMWRYDSTGQPFYGYPRMFYGNGFVLDGSGTPWSVVNGYPQGYMGGQTMMGAEGPSTLTASVQGNAKEMTFDTSGNAWLFLTDQGNNQMGNFRVKKLDKNLAFVDSTRLPKMTDQGFWGITTDPLGNLWIEGTKGGSDSSMVGSYSIAYKVNSSCSAIVDSAVFRSALKIFDVGGGIVADPNGNIWSAGLIMTDTTGLPDTMHFKHALWKFNSHGQLYSGFPKIYQRGFRLDGSLATARDENGNVYGCGISCNAGGGLDLALWKFDSTGNLLSGFPKFVSNWIANLDEPSARMVIRGNVLWVGTQKANGGVNDLALLKFDLNGNLSSTKYWHTSARTNIRFRDLAVDANGVVWVVADTSSSNNGQSRRALWRYDASGTLNQGYPRLFDGNAFALDANGTPWTIMYDVLQGFSGGQTLAGGEGPTTGVQPIASTAPERFELLQNYPNPFNPTTTITYALASRSHVRLSVFNVLGQEVVRLVDEDQPAGKYAATLNTSSSLSGLPSGVYFYRLTAGTFSSVKKMILMK